MFDFLTDKTKVITLRNKGLRKLTVWNASKCLKQGLILATRHSFYSSTQTTDIFLKRCHLYRSLGLPAPDEPALRSFTDAWMVFVFELGSIAAVLLWFSKNPLENKGLIWLVILAEIFRGVVCECHLDNEGLRCGELRPFYRHPPADYHHGVVVFAAGGKPFAEPCIINA
jgi:hypothetical protein